MIDTESDPLWYKDAVIYELHVRAFLDSTEDGMGDFNGLTQKLDYLQDLGVTAIWLLPFFPSPWRDDGYDIADYTDVHPAYGTLRDFQALLKEAHARDLRVITEIVLNHTSDQHPWFQRARTSPPGSSWRDFYVWSDSPDKYREARVIFKDFETSNWTWDPVARSYYWHRFYSHQPDLNYDNPAVREAMKELIDHWFDMGIDAFRLDAVPYLYEREDTNCENLPETHAFLRELRRHIDDRHKDRMLLAEANQWPEDAIAYFGKADECQMAFHFPVMPRLFMAIRMESRYPIVEILQQTPEIPASCQWAMFLRNHDELTLEMVTDEERDYMYRVYANDRQMRINLGIRRRLAPLLGNDRRKIELMNALLFSLPGTPVIYYGDEIGMGDNIYLGDRNGVRTPMQWSADRNAGFSRANPQRLYLPIIIDPEYHYEAVNVEAQQNNPHSLLWWMKHLIDQRTQFRAFGRGTIEFLHPENSRVLAFIRRYEEEIILVVANLSRFPQHVELDLSRFKGMTPVEVFGKSEFSLIGDQPFVVSLGAHGFYWFSVETRRVGQETLEMEGPKEEAPLVPVASADNLLDDRTLSTLSRILPGFLRTRRWFRGKARKLRSAEIIDAVMMPETTSAIVLVEVQYGDGEPETYVLPTTISTGEAARTALAERSDTVFTRLRFRDGSEGVLHSAMWNKAFTQQLLEAVARKRRIRGRSGEIAAWNTRAMKAAWNGDTPLEAAVLRADQSNSSIVYGDRFLLKIFRAVEPGSNPEVEIGEFLTARNFPNIPDLSGVIEYRPNRGESMVIGVLQNYVPNQGDGWRYSLDELSRFYESALTRHPDKAPDPQRHPLELRNEPIPGPAGELMGSYLEMAALLGQRTAEVHAALAQADGKPEFTPEPFSDHYRQGLYHGMMALTSRSLTLLRQRLGRLPKDAQPEAQRVLELEDKVRGRLRLLRDRRITAMRTRHHGDFHLGQVLFTGKDFVLIDFEGEPLRPLSERRLKRSPLRDVAGMLRSFQYASHAVLLNQLPGVLPRPDGSGPLESWAEYWTAWASASFLRGYLAIPGADRFLPRTEEELRLLLDAYLIEKAVYEIGYELNNRPSWVRIPLRGLLKLLE